MHHAHVENYKMRVCEERVLQTVQAHRIPEEQFLKLSAGCQLVTIFAQVASSKMGKEMKFN